jgi:hypothetical protein
MTQTAISSFLGNLWHRWPITIIATSLALPTASWTYVHFTPSEVTFTSHNAEQNIPTRLPDTLSATQLSQPRAVAKAQPALSGFRRVKVAPDEVDYIAEDVTMRVFASSPKPRPSRGWSNQVEIGDDVTVRYFASNPAGAKAR